MGWRSASNHGSQRVQRERVADAANARSRRLRGCRRSGYKVRVLCLDMDRKRLHVLQGHDLVADT